MIKILAIASDKTGVGYFRSLRPHQKLQELYPEDFHVDIAYNNEPMKVDELIKYDIIHFHKTIANYEQMAEITNHLRANGVITIMDLDDHWAPDTRHPAYHLIKSGDLDKKIPANLKLVDAVTTTTTIFADEIKKRNPNVYVIPNAIDKDDTQYQPNPVESNKLRVGWLGGSSHKHDIKLLDGMSNKLSASGVISNIQFVVCGFDLRGFMNERNAVTNETVRRPITPKESVWYEYEKIFTDNYNIASPEYKRFLDAFQEVPYPNISEQPYNRVWTKPIDEYANSYNLFDVSLAPLEDSAFNRVKSQLKVLEAGFHKKALIASEVGPYKIDLINAYEKGGSINPNGNALLVPKGGDKKLWAKYVKLLSENPDLVSMLANNLHNTVKDKYELANVTKDRADIYKEIYKKFKK